MSYNIGTIDRFRKESKRLFKKYPSLKDEIARLGQLLSNNPTSGVAIGNGCFKIRLAIASKGKGKTGGARIITYVYINGKTVFLLTIYDKSEKASITDNELQTLLKGLPK